jgi:hypothetical protein
MEVTLWHGNPWVSLRSDQLAPVNMVVDKKEELEKGVKEEEEKDIFCIDQVILTTPYAVCDIYIHSTKSNM